MFHNLRAPYTTSNNFTNSTPNIYTRPYILSHVVPTFLASDPPPRVTGFQSRVWSGPKSPWLVHFNHSRGWKRAEPVQVCFTLRLRDQHKWIQDGCKIYMSSYMAINGPCFMGTWISFKTHLLEVGLTQTGETVPLRTLTTIILLYYIMCEDLYG